MGIKEYVEGGKNFDNIQFFKELRQENATKNFMREIVDSESGEGELEGIPFVAKDAICTEGVTTSAGSKILKDYEPVFDATAVKRLKNSGARFYGKTAQDEFGFGTFSTNNAFGTPRNAHDEERVAGGSSGGAASAVAALDKPIISLGESTGGSITNPAAYNGVVGVTPTYGRVSRYGLVDYANSLDKIGVLAKSVYGAAKGLEVIAGEDENDQTTSDKQVPEYSDLKELEDLKVAVPKQYVELEGLQEGVKQNFEKSLEDLKEVGAEVEYVDMPLLRKDVAVPAYYVIAMSEASTNLAKMSGMRYGMEKDPEKFEDYDDYFSEVRTEGFGKEAKKRILLGTYTRMAGYRDDYYIKAAKVRQKIINQYKQVFEDYDVIASPSMPNIAPKVEEAESMSSKEMYAMDTLTVGPNLAGLPMISVPNGKSNGMPTGLHIVGDHFSENKVFDVAHTFVTNT
jgi:Asp-tRNAAsn/Glu-tRNAGln amidotransferase A subunit and related amidases